jgi:acyl dehydratase
MRSAPEFDRLEIGAELPAFERTTGFAQWNRYAAVNDEFIDVHMDREAARAAGQADVFGMGNLRIAYLHAALHDWLAGRGDVAEFAIQFRALNLLGDRLRCHARVVGKERRDGLEWVDVQLGVTNQKGEETAPGTARLVLFPDGKGRVPPAPPPAAIPRDRVPGVHLDAKTIGCLGRPLAPDVALPVGANDIRRWASATYHPQLAPPELWDEAAAARGPWGGLVAPRDFNVFAWTRCTPPDTYPWMRGMGTEPGRRGLNGGQRNRYFAPIRPGDVITSVVTLIDAYEKQGRLGAMLFLIDEARWTNQRGELVRIGQRTSIYH